MAVSTEKKRIFIGGLSSSVTEDDIKHKFGQFGEIHSVDIKTDQRNDQNIFAFVEMTAMPNNFNKCITTFSKTLWKGSELKLQMAKESFLDRLKREREAHNTNGGELKVAESYNSEPLTDKNQKRYDDSNYSHGGPKFKSNDGSKRNTDYNERSDSNYLHILQKFNGISAFKRNLVEEKSESKKWTDFEPSESKKSKRATPMVSEAENGDTMSSSNENSAFMTKLEKFSGGVWGDDRPDHSFEVVKEGWSSTKSADDEVLAVKRKKSKDSVKVQLATSTVGSSHKQLLSNEKRLQTLHLKQSTVEMQQNIVKDALSKVSTPSKIFYTSGDEDEAEMYGDVESEIQEKRIWGYKDVNETIHQKSFFNKRDKQFQNDGFNENQSSARGEMKKKHWTEFVSERYDPTSKDHSKYEVKRHQYKMEQQPKETLEIEKKNRAGKEEGNTVSGERFFEVTSSLCDVFTEKSNQSFSLMELFSSNKGRKTDFSKNFDRNSVRFGEEPRSDSYDNRKRPHDMASDPNVNVVPPDLSAQRKFFDAASKDCDAVSTDKTFFLFNGDSRLTEGVESFCKQEDMATIENKWERKKDELRSYIMTQRKKNLNDMKASSKMVQEWNHQKVRSVKQRKRWSLENSRK